MARPATLVDVKRKRGRPRKVLAAEKPVFDHVKPGYVEARPRSSFSSNDGSAIGCSRELRPRWSNSSNDGSAIGCGRELQPRPARVLKKEAEVAPAVLPLPPGPVCLSRGRIELSSSAVEGAHEQYHGCREERAVLPSEPPLSKVIRIRVADPYATDSDSDDDGCRPPKIYIQEIRIPFRIRSEVATLSKSDEVGTKLPLTSSTPQEREPEFPLTNKTTPQEREPEFPLTNKTTPQEEHPDWALTNTPEEVGKPEPPLTARVREFKDTRERNPLIHKLNRQDLIYVAQAMEKSVKRKRRTPRLYSSSAHGKPASSLPSSSPTSVLDVLYDIPGPIPDFPDLYTISLEKFFDSIPDFDL